MTVPLQNGDVYSVQVGSYITSPQNQAGINRFHVAVSGVIGGTINDGNLATYFDDLLAPLYKLIFSTTTNYYGVKVTRKVPAPTAIPQVAIANSGVGTASGTLMAPTLSALVQMFTQRIGKTGRGRLFVPFPTSEQTVIGIPNAAYIVNVLAIATQVSVVQSLIIGAESVVLTPVITGKLVTSPIYAITSVDVAPWWVSQHRRGNYGRQNVLPPFDA